MPPALVAWSLGSPLIPHASRASRALTEKTLGEGIVAARVVEERFLLPRLLAATAELRPNQRRFGEAATLLEEEAAEMLSGRFTCASRSGVSANL